MTLSLLIFVAGYLTLAWAAIGFILMHVLVGETVFTESRPLWLTFLCWAHTTLALLAWSCFLSVKHPLSCIVVGILTLSAAKFVFFYAFYTQWFRAFRYLWNRRIIFYMILGCGAIVGIFMLFISQLIA